MSGQGIVNGRNAALVLIIGALASMARAEPPPVELPLRIVGATQFCARLRTALAAYGQASGLGRVQTTLMAAGATAGIMQEFRAGRATDFINAKALAAFADVTSLPDRSPAGDYVPLADVIGGAMGLAGPVTLALSPAELRFIPYAQQGMDLVVISPSAAAVTPARARKVAEVARAMRIKIHVVWVGETDGPGPALDEARALAWLAAITGGSFANLGGPGNPCAGAS